MKFDKTILIAALGIAASFVVQLLIIAINNESELILKRQAVAQTVVKYQTTSVSYLRSDSTINRIQVTGVMDQKRMADIDLSYQGDLNKVLEMEGQIEGDLILFFADAKLMNSFASLKKDFHDALNLSNHRALKKEHITNQEIALEPYLAKFNPLTGRVLADIRPSLNRKVLLTYSVLALIFLIAGLIGYSIGKEGSSN